MKNPIAKHVASDFRRFFLRVIFVDYPRLLWQKRRAQRRGEDIRPVLAEADRLGDELVKKLKLYLTARKADKILSKAGWQ